MRMERWVVAALALWAALVALSVVAISPVWAGVVTFWFGCLAAQRWYEPTLLPRAVRAWHIGCTLAFPVVATAVKLGEALAGDEESTGISNRLQHLSWAFCTVFLFAPTLVRWMRGRRPFEVAVMAMGLVALLGNLNEVGEWQRGAIGAGRAYDDTIKDLVMNALGSGLAALVLLRVGRAARYRSVLPETGDHVEVAK